MKNFQGASVTQSLWLGCVTGCNNYEYFDFTDMLAIQSLTRNRIENTRFLTELWYFSQSVVPHSDWKWSLHVVRDQSTTFLQLLGTGLWLVQSNQLPVSEWWLTLRLLVATGWQLVRDWLFLFDKMCWPKCLVFLAFLCVSQCEYS